MSAVVAPPTFPLAPESQRWVPGTEGLSPATGPAWPQPGAKGSGKQQVSLPKVCNGETGRLACKYAHLLGPREMLPPRRTVLERAERGDPGVLPRSPRLRGVSIHITSRACTDADTWPCPDGHRALYCDPSFRPSLRVAATVQHRLRDPHEGSCSSSRGSPGGTSGWTHSQQPLASPSPGIPSKHTLPPPQADGGHRPPWGTTKR